MSRAGLAVAIITYVLLLVLKPNLKTLKASNMMLCAGVVFAAITYVLLLGAGKDPWEHIKSLIPSRQSLGAPSLYLNGSWLEVGCMCFIRLMIHGAPGSEDQSFGLGSGWPSVRLASTQEPAGCSG